jgi:hypothetical protein
LLSPLYGFTVTFDVTLLWHSLAIQRSPSLLSTPCSLVRESRLLLL